MVFPSRFACSLLLLLLLAAIGLAGCRSGPSAEIFPAPAVTATPTPAVAATATPPPANTPTPAVTATATATPAPPAPALTTADQTTGEAGEIVVTDVVLPVAGWVVLLDDQERLLGATALEAGSHERVVVRVDPLQIGRFTLARLYTGPEPFDPETATPLLHDDSPVEGRFAVETAVTLPALAASDQQVGPDGLVTVDHITAREDGWIAVYNDAAGTPGELIGLLFVKQGSGPATVPVRRQLATPQLHLALHRDTGRIGRFDYPDSDPAVMVRGEPLVTTIAATFPPDILVIDQPVINNQIVVERVVAYEPAWIVVYRSEDGESAGNIIGRLSLAPGVHEQIAIPIVATAATPTLLLQMHSDTNQVGEFEFPIHDPPLMPDGRFVWFSLNTEAGNYVLSADQTPVLTTDGQAAFSVPLAVAVGPEPFWIVIRADDGGAPGAVLGYTWAPPGIHRDVTVLVDAAEVTPILYVVLHIDVGTEQEFNYPGLDVEMQRRRALLAVPFLVLSEE